jgi:hypothetical protein
MCFALRWEPLISVGIVASLGMVWISVTSPVIRIRFWRIVVSGVKLVASQLSGGGKSGSTNYKHKKWSPPKPGKSSVRHIDGVYHAYCGYKHNNVKCGWNKLHLRGFHQQWSANSSTFNFAEASPTHELVLKTKSSFWWFLKWIIWWLFQCWCY